MSTLKKIFSLIIILALLVSVAGCGGKENTVDTSNTSNAGNNEVSTNSEGKNDKEQEKTADGEKDVKYVIPGNIPGTDEGFASAMEAINEKLKEDGMDFTFELVTIPWDAWDQKTTMMLASNEEFDLLHVMEDVKGFADLLGRGAITDLTEYIESYGSNIKRVIPDYMMEAAKVNGKIYTVPAFWADTVKGTQALTLRTDLLEKYSLETPKTAEDLINFMEVVTANWEGSEKPYMIILVNEPARFLHRTFDTYPFTVIEQLIYISQDGEVKPWYLTEEFKQEAAFYETCYKKGFIHPDVLTIPQETIDNNKRTGNYLFRDGTGLSSIKDAETYGYTEDLVWLAPEKKDFADMAFRNDNVVPVTSSNPEDAVKFLDWIYASQENYDLFMYGVEGVHWNAPAEGQYESLRSENDEVLYKFPNWMIANVNYERVDPNTHPTWVETHLTVNEDFEKSIALGFQFDTSNVSTEYSNCLAEVKSSLYPVKVGLVSYDEAIESLDKNFKAAGIDAVIEEFQRQLDEWLASKN